MDIKIEVRRRLADLTRFAYERGYRDGAQAAFAEIETIAAGDVAQQLEGDRRDQARQRQAFQAGGQTQGRNEDWGIENRHHYVRDVSFFEDQSRIRNKPGHFARLRTFALNIMRANRTKNVSREIYINVLKPDHAISYAVT